MWPNVAWPKLKMAFPFSPLLSLILANSERSILHQRLCCFSHFSKTQIGKCQECPNSSSLFPCDEYQTNFWWIEILRGNFAKIPPEIPCLWYFIKPLVPNERKIIFLHVSLSLTHSFWLKKLPILMVWVPWLRIEKIVCPNGHHYELPKVSKSIYCMLLFWWWPTLFFQLRNFLIKQFFVWKDST